MLCMLYCIIWYYTLRFYITHIWYYDISYSLRYAVLSDAILYYNILCHTVWYYMIVCHCKKYDTTLFYNIPSQVTLHFNMLHIVTYYRTPCNYILPIFLGGHAIGWWCCFKAIWTPCAWRLDKHAQDVLPRTAWHWFEESVSWFDTRWNFDAGIAPCLRLDFEILVSLAHTPEE